MLHIILVSTIAGVVGTGIGGLAGLIFGRSSNNVVSYLLAFAGGVMLSIVFFDLVPEAMRLSGPIPVSVCVLVGVFVVWLLNFAIDRFTHSGDIHVQPQDMYHQGGIIAKSEGCELCPENKKQKLRCSMLNSGILMFAVIALHNFPEGLAIGSSGAHSETMGLMLGLLIALHNIPEGISIAVPLIEGGMNKYKAVLLTALSGAPTLLGGLTGMLIGGINDHFVAYSLAVAGGAMLYVTFCEILPQVTMLNRSRRPAVFSVVGVLVGMIMVNVLSAC